MLYLEVGSRMMYLSSFTYVMSHKQSYNRKQFEQPVLSKLNIGKKSKAGLLGMRQRGNICYLVHGGPKRARRRSSLENPKPKTFSTNCAAPAYRAFPQENILLINSCLPFAPSPPPPHTYMHVMLFLVPPPPSILPPSRYFFTHFLGRHEEGEGEKKTMSVLRC